MYMSLYMYYIYVYRICIDVCIYIYCPVWCFGDCVGVYIEFIYILLYQYESTNTDIPEELRATCGLVAAVAKLVCSKASL